MTMILHTVSILIIQRFTFYSQNAYEENSLAFAFLGLSLTILAYVVPIAIWRYVVAKEPMDKFSAIMLAVFYGIMVKSVFYYLTKSNSFAPTILWSWVNYKILHSGYQANDMNEQSSLPEQKQPETATTTRGPEKPLETSEVINKNIDVKTLSVESSSGDLNIPESVELKKKITDNQHELLNKELKAEKTSIEGSTDQEDKTKQSIVESAHSEEALNHKDDSVMANRIDLPSVDAEKAETMPERTQTNQSISGSNQIKTESYKSASQIRYCRKCGLEQNAGARFCRRCGTKVL